MCLLVLLLWKWLVNGNSATPKMSQPEKLNQKNKNYNFFFFCSVGFLTLWVEPHAAILHAREQYAYNSTICYTLNDPHRTMWNVSTSDYFITQKCVCVCVCMHALWICTSAFAIYCKSILNVIPYTNTNTYACAYTMYIGWSINRHISISGFIYYLNEPQWTKPCVSIW